MLAGLLAMECTQPLLCVNVRVARKTHARERATGVAGHVYAASDDALEGFPSAELAPLGGEQGDAVHRGRVKLNNVCRRRLALLRLLFQPPQKSISRYSDSAAETYDWESLDVWKLVTLGPGKARNLLEVFHGEHHGQLFRVCYSRYWHFSPPF